MRSLRATARLRPHPAALAVALGFAVGAVILLASGANPADAYRAMLVGALSPAGLPSTLVWAVSVVGMTLAAALPLRAGLLNLGGDGQAVIGALIAALVPLALPGPGPLVAGAAILLAMAGGGIYALVAALGEVRRGIPLLISSLLLVYPAQALASYLVTFPLRDTTTGLAQTRMVPLDARLPTVSGPVSAGLLLMLLAAVAAIAADRITVFGFEVRLRGLNPRFAAYGGVSLARQTYALMGASGALAGLVGAIVVLGSHFRFIDGALPASGYGTTGLMAALLAGGEPLGSTVAGLFFSALQVGGVAMQRETDVPRVLTMVLQATIILVLASRGRIRGT